MSEESKFPAEEPLLCNDSRATAELFSSALLESEEELEYWDIIDTLRARADQEVFEAARNCCQSISRRERQVGVDVLMKLGEPERVFAGETLGILLRLVDQEPDPDVLAECCAALGFFDDARIVEPLLRRKDHPYAKVRLRVVWSLPIETNERALDAIVERTADANAEVRDWATAKLCDHPVDNTMIRAALFRRLDDSDEATAMEALLGLAKRGDKRILKRLLQALAARPVREQAIEAARELGDARCYRPLLRIQELENDSLLHEARQRCKRKRP